MRFQFDSEMVCFLSRLTSAKQKIIIIVFFLWINLHLKNSNIIESESFMFLVRRRDMSYRLRVPTEAQPLQKAVRLYSASRQHNTIRPNILIFFSVSFREDAIEGIL